MIVSLLSKSKVFRTSVAFSSQSDDIHFHYCTTHPMNCVFKNYRLFLFEIRLLFPPRVSISVDCPPVSAKKIHTKNVKHILFSSLVFLCALFVDTFSYIKIILFCFWHVKMLFSVFSWQFCCCYWWKHMKFDARLVHAALLFTCFVFDRISIFTIIPIIAPDDVICSCLLYRYPNQSHHHRAWVCACEFPWCFECAKTPQNEPIFDTYSLTCCFLWIGTKKTVSS